MELAKFLKFDEWRVPAKNTILNSPKFSNKVQQRDNLSHLEHFTNTNQGTCHMLKGNSIVSRKVKISDSFAIQTVEHNSSFAATPTTSPHANSVSLNNF